MPKIFGNTRSRPRAWSFSANASQTIRALSAEFPCIRKDPARNQSRRRSRGSGINAKEIPSRFGLKIAGLGIVGTSIGRANEPAAVDLGERSGNQLFFDVRSFGATGSGRSGAGAWRGAEVLSPLQIFDCDEIIFSCGHGAGSRTFCGAD